MTADEVIQKTIKPIAENAFADALEILQLIALLKAQNANNVNKGLNKAGAGRAAIVARNAFIAQLTILVARCYTKPRSSDLHIRKAFEIIAKDQRIRPELQRRGFAAKLNYAETMWSRCRDDARLGPIQHFRNKFTAHIAEPDDGIPLPKYDELFPFAIATATVMQALGNATGVNTHKLSDWDDELFNTAAAFWKPWVSDAPT